jgi:hypothetical protein
MSSVGRRGAGEEPQVVSCGYKVWVVVGFGVVLLGGGAGGGVWLDDGHKLVLVVTRFSVLCCGGTPRRVRLEGGH